MAIAEATSLKAAKASRHPRLAISDAFNG